MENMKETCEIKGISIKKSNDNDNKYEIDKDLIIKDIKIYNINEDNIIQFDKQKTYYAVQDYNSQCYNNNIEQWQAWFTIPYYYLGNYKGRYNEMSQNELTYNIVGGCYDKCKDEFIINEELKCENIKTFKGGKYKKCLPYDPFAIICILGSSERADDKFKLVNVHTYDVSGNYYDTIKKKRDDNDNFLHKNYMEIVNKEIYNLILENIKLYNINKGSILFEINNDIFEAYSKINNYINYVIKENERDRIKIEKNIKDDINKFYNLFDKRDELYIKYLNNFTTDKKKHYLLYAKTIAAAYAVKIAVAEAAKEAYAVKITEAEAVKAAAAAVAAAKAAKAAVAEAAAGAEAGAAAAAKEAAGAAAEAAYTKKIAAATSAGAAVTYTLQIAAAGAAGAAAAAAGAAAEAAYTEKIAAAGAAGGAAAGAAAGAAGGAAAGTAAAAAKEAAEKEAAAAGATAGATAGAAAAKAYAEKIETETNLSDVQKLTDDCLKFLLEYCSYLCFCKNSLYFKRLQLYGIYENLVLGDGFTINILPKIKENVVTDVPVSFDKQQQQYEPIQVKLENKHILLFEDYEQILNLYKSFLSVYPVLFTFTFSFIIAISALYLINKYTNNRIIININYYFYYFLFYIFYIFKRLSYNFLFIYIIRTIIYWFINFSLTDIITSIKKFITDNINIITPIIFVILLIIIIIVIFTFSLKSILMIIPYTMEFIFNIITFLFLILYYLLILLLDIKKNFWELVGISIIIYILYLYYYIIYNFKLSNYINQISDNNKVLTKSLEGLQYYDGYFLIAKLDYTQDSLTILRYRDDIITYAYLLDIYKKARDVLEIPEEKTFKANANVVGSI